MIDCNKLTILIALLAFVSVIGYHIGRYRFFSFKESNLVNDKDKVVPDPEYAEWYIQHVGYADGHSSYTVYHKSEDTVPWSHGTFDSFEGALVILNEAKARQEANRVVLKRNFIVR